VQDDGSRSKVGHKPANGAKLRVDEAVDVIFGMVIGEI
jgi:hypothetical protein